MVKNAAVHHFLSSALQPLCVEVRPRSSLMASAGHDSPEKQRRSPDAFSPGGGRPDSLSRSVHLIYCLKTKCMHLYKTTISPQRPSRLWTQVHEVQPCSSLFLKRRQKRLRLVSVNPCIIPALSFFVRANQSLKWQVIMSMASTLCFCFCFFLTCSKQWISLKPSV